MAELARAEKELFDWFTNRSEPAFLNGPIYMDRSQKDLTKSVAVLKKNSKRTVLYEEIFYLLSCLSIIFPKTLCENNIV